MILGDLKRGNIAKIKDKFYILTDFEFTMDYRSVIEISGKEQRVKISMDKKIECEQYIIKDLKLEKVL